MIEAANARKRRLELVRMKNTLGLKQQFNKCSPSA